MTDSNAETTNRQPARASVGPQLGVAQDVLDLRRAVEGEVGEALVHRLHDAQRVAAAVEEVGIAEGDVAGAQLDEARDVPHHGVRADDADAPVVDGGHRAVAAPVHAAVARLDVPHEPLVAPERQVRVALERRQQLACRELELAAAELDQRLVRSGAGRRRRQLPDPLRQRRLVLAGDHPVGQRADREIAAHRRVEAVEADRQLGPRAADAGRRRHGQAHRGVHRHREADGLAHSSAPGPSARPTGRGSEPRAPRLQAAAGEARCSGWWPSS